VYGPNAAWNDYYESGYSFTAPDEATAITATGADEDLMFCIYSTQDAYISKAFQFIDAVPNGDSNSSIYIEDDNMKRTDVIVPGIKGQQTTAEAIPRPYFMIKGGKFEQEYNDDFTDGVSNISLTIQYYHEPNTPNG